MYKLIDSHCHLPLNKEKLDTMISEAKDEGVQKFINIGTNIRQSKKACELAKNHKDIFATIGIYPHEEKKLGLDAARKRLQNLINQHKKIVGVGECGIDISEWKNGRSIPDQVDLLKMQIELALENNLPLIIHNRNGDRYVIEALNSYKSNKLRGVAHCFASAWETAQKLINLGFYISFSGMITYSSRKALLETVKSVPLDKFVLETDSPYLPPTGHRGEQNKPKYVKIVALKMAETRNEEFETICRHSYDNTCHIFGLEDNYDC